MLDYSKIMPKGENKMKNNNITSHIIILGVIILCVFSHVAAKNLIPKNISSNEFFSKVDEKMIAKIENYKSNEGNLIVNTSGQAKEICVKATKSTPKSNSICWNKVIDNQVSISIYSKKVYYIWIKDNKNNISSVKVYNPNK